uniref:Uncharacterized protein n=1 Tax=Glossina austeni TaxID=7395 RepID=A0A1A9UCT6_GLOAU
MLPLSTTRSSGLVTSFAEPRLKRCYLTQHQTQYGCLSRANNQDALSPPRQKAANKSRRNSTALDAGNASCGHYIESACAVDRIFDRLLENAPSTCALNIIYELHDFILKKSSTINKDLMYKGLITI